MIFTEDLSILFSKGNMIRINFDDKDEIANTIARWTLYIGAAAALYFKKSEYALYGVVAVFLLGFLFSMVDIETYLGPRVRGSQISSVHNLIHGNTKRERLREFRNSLLNNVRERNFYLGGAIEIPRGEEYMLGGTRPLASNRTDALRNDSFFKNVHGPAGFVMAEPVQHL